MASLRVFRDQRGSAAAEFALLLPVFALLVLGIFHFCALVYASSSLHWAVEQAARCAAVSRLNTGLSCGTTTSTTEAYALQIYKGPNIGLSAGSFTAQAVTDANGNTCRQVSGTGTYRIQTGLVNVDVPLSASACFPAATTPTWAAS